MKIRLNKFLAEAGISSRRKCDDLILSGRVDVNGKTIVELGFTIDPENDSIAVDGELIKKIKFVYYLLNKPKKYICSLSDEKGRAIVTDLIPGQKRLFPVGRLDYNTTGVLLITNDGDFSNYLLHPSHKVKRIYEVKLDKPLLESDKEKLLSGIIIEGKKGKFESVLIQKNPTKVHVTSTEGRNHFVKKMFDKLLYKVEELHRSEFAGFRVDGMALGSFRVIPYPEIQRMKKHE